MGTPLDTLIHGVRFVWRGTTQLFARKHLVFDPATFTLRDDPDAANGDGATVVSGAGGGSGSLDGDASGPAGENVVVGIQTFPVVDATPTYGSSLVYRSRADADDAYVPSIPYCCVTVSGTGAITDLDSNEAITNRPVTAFAFTGAAPVLRGIALDPDNNNDGREVTLLASNGPLVVLHESSLETTAAHQISTPTGSSVTIAHGCAAKAIWSEATGKWRLAIISSYASGGTVLAGALAPGDNPNTATFVANGVSATGTTATLPNAVKAGAVILVMVQTESGIATSGAVTVTDNRGSTYTVVATSIAHGTSADAMVLIGTATSDGSLTISTTGLGASFPRVTACQLYNIGTTPDNVSVVYQPGPITGNVTNTTPNAAIIGLVATSHSSVSWVPGAGYTTVASGSGSDSSHIEYKTVSSAGSNVVDAAIGQTSVGLTLFAIAFPGLGGRAPGNDGDFFYDSTSKKLYGPRVGGVYPLAGTLT